jgi:hypothetical protein
MNMDYSKVFELLNQDTEKEHNEKAEGVVHDNFYNKGFHDGIAVLDKIRAEIKEFADVLCSGDRNVYYVLHIIDKYKAESEDDGKE